MINGTPTDCVHLAITGLFDFEFDMVVSGVNDGANLGDDVLYSGTVAAAIEGRFLGLPTVAVSLVTDAGPAPHFATAARVARELVQRLLARPLHRSMILNVNVPGPALRGVAGHRGHAPRPSASGRARGARARPARAARSTGSAPRAPAQDAGPGTDFHAVADGFVSVTPLQVDLTRHAALDTLRDWLREPLP